MHSTLKVSVNNVHEEKEKETGIQLKKTKPILIFKKSTITSISLQRIESRKILKLLN